MVNSGSRAEAPRIDEKSARTAADDAARPAPHFPPSDFPPPSAKSAAEGDGHWTAWGESGALARTVVHPHPDSRWITVTIAAADLSRTRLRLVAGTQDREWAKLPPEPGAGAIPEGERARAVAVMNGGFQPQHGRWGLVANGVTISKPKDGGCTLSILRNGAVDLSPGLPASIMDTSESIRQTPPCLVQAGAVHPSLLAGRDKAWAGHVADLTTRRRSAIGVDATGSVLFYAVGEEAEPRWLAEGLRLAGAAAAAELDINWYWTRCLLVEQSPQGPSLGASLIPKMEHLPSEYVERPSTRDFFYLLFRETPVKGN